MTARRQLRTDKASDYLLDAQCRPWNRIRDLAPKLLPSLTGTWNALLGDARKREEDYHEFIASHAGLFFANGIDRYIVLSKISLGDEFKIDFAIPKDCRSMGTSYELVEIESPHVAPYNNKGDPSARLITAMQQIQNWKKWLSENRSRRDQIFPFTRFVKRVEPAFRYKIIIGKRSNSEKWQDRRILFSRDLSIEIRSFDYLTDCLVSRQFTSQSILASEQEKNLCPQLRSELANPFFCAYSEQEWKQLLLEHRPPGHFVADNADIIVKYRRHSEYLRRFERAIRRTQGRRS